MSRYVELARKEHGTGTRIAGTLLAGVVVVILVPALIVVGGSRLDSALGLPPIDLGAANYILGGLLLAVGLSLGLWANQVQLTQGRGTPLPVMPTQELLTGGPFRYCRNPMTLGTILAYLGIALMAGTIAGIGIALCLVALLMLYLKRLEEAELAERFGAAYLAYKRDVPFILPRRPRRR